MIWIRITMNPFFFTSIKEALAELDLGDCYAFVTDVKMPLLSGDQVVTYVSRKYPEQACLVITGHAEKAKIQRIAQAGNVRSILLKPLNFDKLLECLNLLQLNLQLVFQLNLQI